MKKYFANITRFFVPPFPFSAGDSLMSNNGVVLSVNQEMHGSHTVHLIKIEFGEKQQ